MNGNGIEPIKIEDEMKRSFIDYSMSVIVSRALPDARDGLKPVHRRVLFAMKELANTHARPYKKSARVVGDVIGKYHPHGDQAVYDTIVRMAQDFSLRYLLVDGQGNFGSLDGDPPAAMRYTEVRMKRMAEELLADIDKDTVDFGPNYDGQSEEPLILPARLPNLLLNGATGIAVGMATNIPPHNLGELVDAIVHLIDTPKASVEDLMEYVKGPDFPTAGMILGTAAIKSMYLTGRGQMRVRGAAGIEDISQGKEAIIVTSLPYTVNKARLIENIAKLVQAKKLEGISDLRDESNKDGIRIVIELKRGVPPKVVLNNLYKHTQMQTTFGAIMLALTDGRPKVMNLKEILQCFLAHRFDVITRRTRYELKKAEERAHILEGLKVALDNLDAVVKIIRDSKNRDEARAKLLSSFGLTEVQANAILDMRLYQLTGLERDKIEAEYLDLIKLISQLREILENDSRVYSIIREEVTELKELYGDERRTEIVPAEGEMKLEDLVADKSAVITISHEGYIKRVPTTSYREQRRGGKGVAGMATKEEDFVEQMFMASTHDTILFFTTKGQMYWEGVFQVPEAGRAARGKAIVNLLNISREEKLAAMIRVREFDEEHHLVMATRKGTIKKTKLSAFKHLRGNSLIAIKIDEDDELVGVKMTSGDDDVVMVTEKGMSIRFHEDDLRSMGRATRGVRGVKLKKDDSVQVLEIVDHEATLFMCTEHGYGKRTAFDEYRGQKRGGSGVMAIRTSERNGNVVGAHAVKESDSMMLISAQGKMIRMNVSDTRIISRVTQGVKLIDLGDGDRLVSATPVAPGDDDVDDEGEGEGEDDGES